MRPTKEDLIKTVCQNMALVEFPVDDATNEEALSQQIAGTPEAVIYSITQAGQVGRKLLLTAHQFTNVVGTDLYVYIGNAQGQEAYQRLLDEMSKVRRLDEKLVTFLRDECNDALTEISLKEELPERVPEKIEELIAQTPESLIFSNVSESLLNRGIGRALLENHFNAIGDSHIFIYSGNTVGTQMVNRLEQEPFIHLE